jgi:hypothetical protein
VESKVLVDAADFFLIDYPLHSAPHLLSPSSFDGKRMKLGDQLLQALQGFVQVFDHALNQVTSTLLMMDSSDSKSS